MKRFDYKFGFTRFAESTEDAEDLRADIERITQALSGMDPARVKALADRLEAGDGGEGEGEEFAPDSREHDQPRAGELTQEEYAANREGFHKLGAKSYAEARRLMSEPTVPAAQTGMRSGQEGHAGVDPESVEYPGPAGGEGSAWTDKGTNRSPAKLTKEEKRDPLVQFADKFAERHAKDFELMGVNRAEFARTYRDATPEQRRELCFESR